MGKRKVLAIEEEKGNDVDHEKVLNWDPKMVMDNAAAIAALGGARRARKRFVGIRQRPSGRWVAEIKDTIQKIRVWLGTYDTAEEAARAYDEAACLLRGVNTRTNFWPCSPSSHYSTPALPSKIVDLLLLRLKARESNDVAASAPASILPAKGNEAEAEGEEMCVDDFFNLPGEEDCTLHVTSSSSTSTPTTTFSSTTASSDCMLEMKFGSNFAEDGNLNHLTAIGNNYFEGGREEEKEGLKEEEGSDDMGRLMDLQLEDALALSCYFSPFEIAEEMVENQPVEQQENDGNNEYDDPMLRETMKRMKYERKFSASLYAFNGIPECLRLKQHESGNYDHNKPAQQYSNLRNNTNSSNFEKKFEIKEETVPAEISIETGSSSYSSSISNEAAAEIWSSLDLPPICFMN